MAAKHFAGASEIVREGLAGLVAAHPQLAIDAEHKVVYRARARASVALVSGGGAGHEPAHAGYVGEGMLTAAVSGHIFASPGPAQIRAALRRVNSPAGTLLLVKNYTGDVLNFGLAAEQRAAGADVRMVVIGDDVAVGRTQGALVGRRGLAGTVLVHKLAGALAAAGATLDEVHALATYTAGRLATLGVALERAHVPGAPAPEALGPDELELGMGIHNEPGAQRLRPVPALPDLTKSMLDMLLAPSAADAERGWLGDQLSGDGEDAVVLLVNNLGGLPPLELAAAARAAQAQLAARGLRVARALVGTFMTSLAMPGYSISLLLLPRTGDKGAPLDEARLLALLDAPTDAPGWPRTGGAPNPSSQEENISEKEEKSESTGDATPALRARDPAAFEAAVRRACEALFEAEPEITRLDTIAGDGDCGTTLKAGAEGVLASPAALSGADVAKSMRAIGDVAAARMGGTSGALYAIFFSALARALASSSTTDQEATPRTWAAALESALGVLYTYTRARPPSRTLVDPLAAFIRTVTSNEEIDWAAAVRAAREAADATRDQAASAGRAAYVGADALAAQRVPDPGAVGVSVILEALFASA